MTAWEKSSGNDSDFDDDYIQSVIPETCSVSDNVSGNDDDEQ